MTTPKTPTPQGISALLKKAGFRRAVHAPLSAVASGYHVTKNYSGGVCIRHSPIVRISANELAAELGAYADAVQSAGWAVATGPDRLIVTARKDQT